VIDVALLIIEQLEICHRTCETGELLYKRFAVIYGCVKI
jgi:hypothetical protein